jgi:hypothetical protein
VVYHYRYFNSVDMSLLLRKIFGPKRDEVTGGWRKQHNLDNAYKHTSYRIHL